MVSAKRGVAICIALFGGASALYEDQAGDIAGVLSLLARDPPWVTVGSLDPPGPLRHILRGGQVQHRQLVEDGHSRGGVMLCYVMVPLLPPVNCRP
jgi:hypothetical protein